MSGRRRKAGDGAGSRCNAVPRIVKLRVGESRTNGEKNRYEDILETPGQERAKKNRKNENECSAPSLLCRGSAAVTGALPGGSVRGERANSTRLVLSCIEAKFCKQILVGKLWPRSTQCTPLHRSLISIFSSKIAKKKSRLNN